MILTKIFLSSLLFLKIQFLSFLPFQYINLIVIFHFKFKNQIYKHQYLFHFHKQDNTKMFVSGLTIEGKKTYQHNYKSTQKNHKNQRPSSTQLPQIYQANKFSNTNIQKRYAGNNLYSEYKKQKQNTQNVQKERHSSMNKGSFASNKIIQKKNFSSKKDLSGRQQYQDQNQRQSIKKKQFNNAKLVSIKEIKQSKGSNNDSNKNLLSSPTLKMQKKSSTANKKKLQLKDNKSNQKDQLNNTSKLPLFQQAEKIKIMKYFRYYPMIIMQACCKREAFMSSLGQNGEAQVWNKGSSGANNTKSTRMKQKTNNSTVGGNKKISIGEASVDPYEAWAKLIKLAGLKGKYKYRQKFNFLYSTQLKAISFKRKQTKKKKQSSSSSQSEQEQKKQKFRDIETWKKSNGVEGAKVFIIKGKYPDFKNALLERGWVQNPDKTSSFFDLKWTTKVNDIIFESLKPNQIVNHFNNNACLTSKYGICKSLRSIMYSEEIDIDKFFPKAFDLTDSSDFQNFLQVYKWVYCQSLLKRYVQKQKNQQQPKTSKANNSSLNLQIVKIAYIIINRRLSRPQTIIKNTLQQKYFVSSINQWLTITDEQLIKSKQLNWQSFQAWGIGQNIDELEFTKKAQHLLDLLYSHQPQFELNGQSNIWIVKPAFLSRGRGIKCLNKFNDILNYSLGKDTQYVVQKYIQNPLIINKRKFDIRQWVLVEDYNPPKIWIYGQFYLRFCIEQYNQSKLTNKFAHLTNNSIQKYNKNLTQAELKESLKTSMWTQQQLVQFINQAYPSQNNSNFKTIRQKMKQIIISTILSTIDQVYGRRNSFELIGYDFMIDTDLNPWLIEINTSPAMDYSTPVTERLVKAVLEDTVKVVVDLKKKKNKKKTAGLWKCGFNGEEKFISKYYNLLKQNKRKGQEDE